MEFYKYQHIEKFGREEVEGIEIGTCYVFPKIDGTNSSLWVNNGELKAGSRNRELSLDKDNAGFYNWAIQQENLKEFFKNNPNIKLFGEWLVKHSLTTYRDNAWRDFYVFDVLKEENGEFKYLPYEEYKILIEKYNINYIPCQKIIKNGGYEDFIHEMQNNNYLIQEGKGIGEGIVIKNYQYVNKFGRITWAKMVSSEFKEVHYKTMGSPEKENKLVEEEVVEKYVTEALVNKVFAKITLDNPWNNKRIPELLERVYHDLVTEDTWDIVKGFKLPIINFKTLRSLTVIKIKKIREDLF